MTPISIKDKIMILVLYKRLSISIEVLNLFIANLIIYLAILTYYNYLITW